MVRVATPHYPTRKAYDGNLPDRCVVREVNFRIRNRKLYFYFSRGRDFSLTEAHMSIGSVIGKLRRDEFVYHGNEPRLKRPYDTPLSLSNEYLSYIVYKLNSDRNWQFWQKYFPITVGGPGNQAQAYFKALRVDYQGNENRGDPEEDPALDRCKIAYMIADGSKFTSEVPAHGVNLHVELVFENDRGQPSFMPLLIDPDVRFPGGSVSEGP